MILLDLILNIFFRSEFMKMSQLLQSSVWRLILLNIAPKFMVFFGINVFYPKASKYFDKLLRQLVKDHKQSRKFGKYFFVFFATNMI